MKLRLFACSIALLLVFVAAPHAHARPKPTNEQTIREFFAALEAMDIDRFLPGVGRAPDYSVQAFGDPEALKRNYTVPRQSTTK